MDLIENIDSSTIRVDKDTKKGSVLDVIKLVLGCDSSNANTSLGRLVQANPDMGSGCTQRCTQLKINGKGKQTPVADAKTLIEIVWLLPGKKAHAFRRQSSEKVCRLLGGDLTLVSEIEARHGTLQGTEEGRATQEFLLDGREETIEGQAPAKKARPEAPFWFDYASDEQKRALVSVVANKAMALEQIDMYDTFKQKLESVEQFATRDKIEFADRIKDAQRRASGAHNMLTAAPVDNSTICVARPVDDSIDPETGLIIATHKCGDSVRGPETSICNEAAKMDVKVGEKAGQVGKVLKRFYSDRYGVEASLNIPKRHTTFRGKPFEERTYYERDADLIQQAIRIVCVPPAKPRQSTTQTLLNFSSSTL